MAIRVYIKTYNYHKLNTNYSYNLFLLSYLIILISMNLLDEYLLAVLDVETFRRMGHALALQVVVHPGLLAAAAHAADGRGLASLFPLDVLPCSGGGCGQLQVGAVGTERGVVGAVEQQAVLAVGQHVVGVAVLAAGHGHVREHGLEQVQVAVVRRLHGYAVCARRALDDEARTGRHFIDVHQHQPSVGTLVPIGHVGPDARYVREVERVGVAESRHARGADGQRCRLAIRQRHNSSELAPRVGSPEVLYGVGRNVEHGALDAAAPKGICMR